MRGRKKGAFNYGTIEKKAKELTEALLLVGEDPTRAPVQSYLNTAPEKELIFLVEAIRKRLSPESWPALFKVLIDQATLRSVELLLEQYPILAEDFWDLITRIKILKGRERRKEE